uniref:DUF1618 domain-containing protein n=1 Tax=Oryza punctata TaxID=4537 RepID=A0A0E0KG17_ORYPU
MAMSGAASFLNWVMLERFGRRCVLPQRREPTVKASGSGSQKTPFNIAFRIADPPAMSRLYVQWPQGPNPEEMVACHLVATHRNLVLVCFCYIVECPAPACPQDYFGCEFPTLPKNTAFIFTAGRGFTITCHTLRTLGLDVEWSNDLVITSDEIRSFKGPDLVPHEVLMFPTVNMDMPNVMHFLTCDYEHVIRKMSVVTINLANKTVLSVIPYVNGQEDLSGEDADMVRAKSGYPQSFLPSEFSNYFNSI